MICNNAAGEDSKKTKQFRLWSGSGMSWHSWLRQAAQPQDCATLQRCSPEPTTTKRKNPSMRGPTGSFFSFLACRGRGRG